MSRRRILIGIVALAAVATALVVLGQDRPEFTTRSNRAYALYLQGEERANAFQQAPAESLLRAAVVLDPSFAMARATHAQTLAALGRREAAKREYAVADSLARALTHVNERLLVQLGLPAKGDGKDAFADSIFAQAEKLMPRHPLVLRAKAVRANLRGDVEAEEAAWRDVLRYDPNYARAYNWLGYVAANQGRYVEGLSYLRRYAFLAPGIANPHDSLGEIYTHMGELDAAEQEFRQALQLQPDFYPSLLGLARVYVAQGRLRRAQDLLEQTRAQFAGTGVATYIDAFAAGILLTHGYNGAATPALARLSAEEPKSAEAAWMRCVLWARAGRIGQARAIGDSLAADWRGSAAYAASEMTRRTVEAHSHSLRALICAKQGEPTQELAEWGRALVEANRFPPHDRWVLQWRYAESLARLGQLEAALAQTNEILSVNPRLIGPLLLQVRTELALGRPDEARATLVRLDAALARADADLPAVAEADSLRRLAAVRPPA